MGQRIKKGPKNKFEMGQRIRKGPKNKFKMGQRIKNGPKNKFELILFALCAFKLPPTQILGASIYT